MMVGGGLFMGFAWLLMLVVLALPVLLVAAAAVFLAKAAAGHEPGKVKGS